MILNSFINTVILFAVLFFIFQFIFRIKARNNIFIHIDKCRKILRWIFVFYFIFVVQITIIRNGISIEDLFKNGELNLLPLSNLINIWQSGNYINFVYLAGGNVFWFIPFGILFPQIFFIRPGFTSTVFFGFLFSFVIEALQYILGTGVSEIDDLILNTIGVMIGYIIYYLISKRKKT